MTRIDTLFQKLQDSPAPQAFASFLNKRTWWGKRVYNGRETLGEQSLLDVALEKGVAYADVVWQAQRHSVFNEKWEDFQKLWAAVQTKNAPLACFLLNKNVLERYEQTDKNLYPLSWFTEVVLETHYHPDIAQAFVQTVDTRKTDVMHSLIHINQVALLRQFLERGAVPDEVLLDHAIGLDGHIVHTLLDYMPEAEMDKCRRWSHLLAHTTSPSVAVRLIKQYGFDVNQRGLKDKTPLMCASSVAVLNVLLKSGADMRLADYKGKRVWSYIVNDPDKVKMALRYVTPNNIIDDYTRQTPLMGAIEAGNTESVRLLLQAGADVTRRDSFGNTALHVAVRHLNLDVIHLLIAAGASATIPNKSGITPLNMARMWAQKNPMETAPIACLKLFGILPPVNGVSCVRRHKRQKRNTQRQHVRDEE